MKKLIIIASILLATSAYGMGGRPHNIKSFGSDDRQHGHHYQQENKMWDSVTPNPPSPVPEPTTLALIGMGLIGLATWSRKK